MATFKVGDRVKKVARHQGLFEYHLAPIGATGTIVGRVTSDEYEWMVEYDGLVPIPPWPYFYAESYMLAPLTDQNADAWASEQVRKWTKPEPVVPVAAKEKA